MGKSQLSKYETGQEVPKLESLEKLLRSLGVGLLDLASMLALIDERAATFGSVLRMVACYPRACRRPLPVSCGICSRCTV